MTDDTVVVDTPKSILTEVTLRLDNCSLALTEGEEPPMFTRMLLDLTKAENGLRGLLVTMAGESNPLIDAALLRVALELRVGVERIESLIVKNLAEQYTHTINHWEE